MPVEYTAIYASVLGLLMIVLSTRVSIMRAKTDIPILHGENIVLAERIRQHANFTENVPVALILMLIVELSGADPLWLNAIGGTLLVSRIIHPFGVNADNKNRIARGIGALLTTLSVLISVVFILLKAF